MVLVKMLDRFLYYEILLKSEKVLSNFVPTAGKSLFGLDTPVYTLEFF